MACEDLVSGVFAGDRASFAMHQLDAERAANYLVCCVNAQLSWEQVKRQIREYLHKEESTVHYQEWVGNQVARAQQMMLPWLEHHREIGTTSTVVNIRD